MLLKFRGETLPKPSLLYVNVTWCGYCRRAMPMMESVAGMLGSAVPVISVDGDEYDVLVKEWGVNSYPTLLYVNEMGAITKFEGDRTIQNIVGFVCSNSTGRYNFCSAKK